MNIPTDLNQRAQDACPGQVIVWEDPEVVWGLHVCPRPVWWSAVTGGPNAKSPAVVAELMVKLLDHVKACR